MSTRHFYIYIYIYIYIYCLFSQNVQFAEPRVHAFVYEPGNGELKKLNVDFKGYINSLQSIYDMYVLPTNTTKVEIDKLKGGGSECMVLDDGEIECFDESHF